eukprot:TRINITY_DN5297_c0_g1_i1.p1 TRINITY_DN5297_c0_g1~~TRINITY_DN5297_c0_g1_i1.p1  ORF type:complete len:630 (-),score=74.19 TRINITY_DN5297_c0_g1_i1:144-2006(-)
MDDLSCRYCRSVEPEEELICPCLCKGSIKSVHQSCLQRWINGSTSSVPKCEICGFTYNYIYRKPSKGFVKFILEAPILRVIYFLVFYSLLISTFSLLDHDWKFKLMVFSLMVTISITVFRHIQRNLDDLDQTSAESLLLLFLHLSFLMYVLWISLGNVYWFLEYLFHCPDNRSYLDFRATKLSSGGIRLLMSWQHDLHMLLYGLESFSIGSWLYLLLSLLIFIFQQFYALLTMILSCFYHRMSLGREVQQPQDSSSEGSDSCGKNNNNNNNVETRGTLESMGKAIIDSLHESWNLLPYVTRCTILISSYCAATTLFWLFNHHSLVHREHEMQEISTMSSTQLRPRFSVGMLDGLCFVVMTGIAGSLCYSNVDRRVIGQIHRLLIGEEQINLEDLTNERLDVIGIEVHYASTLIGLIVGLYSMLPAESIPATAKLPIWFYAYTLTGTGCAVLSFLGTLFFIGYRAAHFIYINYIYSPEELAENPRRFPGTVNVANPNQDVDGEINNNQNNANQNEGGFFPQVLITAYPIVISCAYVVTLLWVIAYHVLSFRGSEMVLVQQNLLKSLSVLCCVFLSLGSGASVYYLWMKILTDYQTWMTTGDDIFILGQLKDESNRSQEVSS